MKPRRTPGLCCGYIPQLRGTLGLCCVHITQLVIHFLAVMLQAS